MKDLIEERKKIKGSQEEDWPENFLEEILCPLCNGKGYKKLYPSSYKRIVKCQNCSLVYTNPRLKKGYLKNLYSKEYFCNTNSSHFGYENYIADEKKIITTFKKRVEKIEKYTQIGSLLDIGCAMGFFMKAASEKNWDVEGLEISKFAAEYASKNYGFKIYNSDFLTIDIKKKFDLITLWDVIEHFYDPIKALSKANNLLKRDGLLVLSTPDVGSIPAKLTGSKWVGYKLSDEHLTYFSEDTIKILLERSGFKMLRKEQIGKHVSIPMLSDRISIYNSLVGNLVKKTSSLFPKDYFLYVNPYDIMCIYAKKI